MEWIKVHSSRSKPPSTGTSTSPHKQFQQGVTGSSSSAPGTGKSNNNGGFIPSKRPEYKNFKW
jgi:hypothetical protein